MNAVTLTPRGRRYPQIHAASGIATAAMLDSVGAIPGAAPTIEDIEKRARYTPSLSLNARYAADVAKRARYTPDLALTAQIEE